MTSVHPQTLVPHMASSSSCVDGASMERLSLDDSIHLLSPNSRAPSSASKAWGLASQSFPTNFLIPNVEQNLVSSSSVFSASNSNLSTRNIGPTCFICDQEEAESTSNTLIRCHCRRRFHRLCHHPPIAGTERWQCYVCYERGRKPPKPSKDPLLSISGSENMNGTRSQNIILRRRVPEDDNLPRPGNSAARDAGTKEKKRTPSKKSSSSRNIEKGTCHLSKSAHPKSGRDDVQRLSASKMRATRARSSNPKTSQDESQQPLQILRPLERSVEAGEGNRSAGNNSKIGAKAGVSQPDCREGVNVGMEFGEGTRESLRNNRSSIDTGPGCDATDFLSTGQNAHVRATIKGLKRKRAAESKLDDTKPKPQDSEIHETLHRLKKKCATEKLSAQPHLNVHQPSSSGLRNAEAIDETSDPVGGPSQYNARQRKGQPNDNAIELNRPEGTWVQLIIEAFEDVGLKPLTARQVCDQIQQKHPWFQDPKHINIKVMRRSLSASLSHYTFFVKRTAGGLDGSDSQSTLCYIYIPDGMSENEVINKIQSSDPEWWQETFQKTNQHKLKGEGAVLYDSDYVVSDNIFASHQIKPRKIQSEPWANLDSHKRIIYESELYKVGDVVQLSASGQSPEYGWIREIRVRRDGRPAIVMFWFYFKDFVSHSRSNALNPEDWPADKDYVLSNCLNVFSPFAIAGKPGQQQLNRIDLKSKVITLLNRSSKLKDMDSDDVSWMFAKSPHPSKFKSTSKGNSNMTERSTNNAPVFHTPAKKYRHPELFKPVQSAGASGVMKLDGFNCLPSRASPTTSAPSKPEGPGSTIPPENEEMHISTASDPQVETWKVTPKRKRRVSDVIQEIAESPLSPPRLKRPRLDEEYSSIKDILQRRPHFSGWDSVRFEASSQKQKRVVLPQSNPQSRQVETPHETFIRYMYQLPPLDDFVQCVHMGRRAYRNRLDGEIWPLPDLSDEEEDGASSAGSREASTNFVVEPHPATPGHRKAINSEIRKKFLNPQRQWNLSELIAAALLREEARGE